MINNYFYKILYKICLKCHLYIFVFSIYILSYLLNVLLWIRVEEHISQNAFCICNPEIEIQKTVKKEMKVKLWLFPHRFPRHSSHPFDSALFLLLVSQINRLLPHSLHWWSQKLISNIWKAAQMLFRKPKYQRIPVENFFRKKFLNIEKRPPTTV